jgi:Domain of Unknown Function with PDB structure (DUF3857)/Transglutaminase-like superfamily
MLGMTLLLLAGASVAREFTRDGIAFAVAPPPSWVVPRGNVPLPTVQVGGAATHYGHIDSQLNRRVTPVQTYAFWSIRANAESALAELGQIPFEFSRDYEQLTLHFVRVCREGRCEERLRGEDVTVARRETELANNMLNGQVTALVVIKDLRVGDVIEVAATWSGENPLLKGLTRDEFALGSQVAIEQRSVRALYPPGALKVIGSEQARPQLKRSAAGTELTLTLKQQPAVRHEDRTPLGYRIDPWMQVSREVDWAAVARWAAALYPRDLPIPPSEQARVAQWRKLPDPLQRAERALRFVQDDIRYFGVFLGDSTHRPNTPEQILEKRYGDCKDKSMLLLSLLRELGINASPALVSIADQDGIRDELPGGNAFDHVIVSFVVDGQRYFVDPTIANERGPLATQATLPYGLALLAEPDTTALTPITGAKEIPLLVEVTERFKRVENGHELTTVSTASGTVATNWRASFAETGQAEMANHYLQFNVKRFGAASTLAPLKVLDDAQSGRLSVTERYLLPNIVSERIGQSNLIDLMAYGVGESVVLPQTFERKMPLFGVPRGRYRHVIELELNPGESASIAEDKIALSEPEFTFKRQFAYADGAASIQTELDNQTEVISAERSKTYLQQLKKINEAVHPRLIIAAPASQQKRTREERLRALLGEKK